MSKQIGDNNKREKNIFIKNINLFKECMKDKQNIQKPNINFAPFHINSSPFKK